MNFQSGKTRGFWIENIVVLMRDNNRGDFEQECFPGSQPLTTQHLAGIGWGLQTPLFCDGGDVSIQCYFAFISAGCSS